MTGSWHQALLYRSPEEYVAGVLGFVNSAVASGDAVLVAVPEAHGQLLQQWLNGTAEAVRFADMTKLGRNPSCIIPAIQQFIDDSAGRKVSFVGEPIWAARTPAEIVEATRHEALINYAFAHAGANVLCPYDVGSLPEAVVADAWRTHPEMLDTHGPTQSARYADPVAVWRELGLLDAPPPGAVHHEIAESSLPAARSLARAAAESAGLDPHRADDLLVVVTELASNSLRHGGGVGRLTIWVEGGSVVCEVADEGRLADPLAGRRAPDQRSAGGRGLWLVNHLCDLVQVHQTASGTVIRARLSPH